MGLHIAVCHIVACDATEGLSTLRAHAKQHELTLVLFYRVAAEDAGTWEDVILVCEGEQPRLDAFIAMLRASEPLLRCASTLMRQWSYTAHELHLPSERVGWGYQEWCDFAAQERHTRVERCTRSTDPHPNPNNPDPTGAARACAAGAAAAAGGAAAAATAFRDGAAPRARWPPRREVRDIGEI